MLFCFVVLLFVHRDHDGDVQAKPFVHEFRCPGGWLPYELDEDGPVNMAGNIGFDIPWSDDGFACVH
jgi:hypothetical protein